MSRRLLHQDLAAVRGLVAAERDRLHAAVGDLDEFWIASAQGRLASVEDRLFRAAGELSGWSRTLIALLFMLAAAAVTALLTGLLGFSVFWVVACSWVVATAVESPVRQRLRKLDPGLGRRRLDRFAAPRAPGGPADRAASPEASAASPETLAASPDALAALPEALAQARVRLVSVALREAGSKRWRAAYLSRAITRQPTMFRLAEADMLLCQAIDYLEVYLAADRKEPT